MESTEAYLLRKDREIRLLNGLLRSPFKLRFPKSVAEVVEEKFRLAASLKAELATRDWSTTETDWVHSGHPHAGPFSFSYDYQRADLEVNGPPIYALDAPHTTIYTASGMAAISAFMVATMPLFPRAELVTLPNTYAETIELVESYAHHLTRVEPVVGTQGLLLPPRRSDRILLLDSCTSASAYEAVLKCPAAAFDLILFDTTCFSTGSGRIMRAIRWARRHKIPVILVRSHTKLDSLGIEYGRLGSAVFVDFSDDTSHDGGELSARLLSEMRKAIRLFGGAAVPAHFPPFVGAREYYALTDSRVAAIMRNARRTRRHFAKELTDLTAQLAFAHALYVTLEPSRRVDESQAREIAEQMCSDLRRMGLPIRHAGSFGFDFGAAEWSYDEVLSRYVVRFSVPDLPTELWDLTSAAVATWWLKNEGGPRAAGKADATVAG